MSLTVDQYAQTLYAALEETKPEQHDQVIENLIAVLQKNGQLELYEAIVNAYETYSTKQQAHTATVTTAQPLQHNADIITELNKAIGKDAVIKQKVDESLVGGVVIRVGDHQIDASIKRQLDQLASTLSKDSLV